MQDNTGTVKVTPTLTDVGKKRLLENKFKITKFALSDDGVNYKLLNKNVSNNDIAIERTPLMKAWKDSTFNLYHKLQVNDEVSKPTETNFNPTFTPLEKLWVHPVGREKQINFPLISSNDGEIHKIQYFMTSNEFSQSTNDIRCQLPKDKSFTIILSEGKYFNIYKKVKDVKNNPLAYDKNHISNVYSKTITVDDEIFYIRYNSKFRRSNLDTTYNCSIVIMDNETGQIQRIKLEIDPVEPYTDATDPNATVEPEKSAPQAPTIKRVVDHDGSLEVEFKPPLWNGESKIRDYQYRLDGGDWITTLKTQSPLRIPNLNNKQQYAVEIRAVNDIGESTSSNTVNATPTTVPQPPIITSITADQDYQLTINYNLDSDDGGSPVTDVEYQIGGRKFESLDTITSPKILENLLGGYTYHIRLRSRNKNGVSDPSNQESETVTFTVSVTIDEINGGSNSLFVYYSLDNPENINNITSLEYRYNNGLWTQTQIQNPAILPISTTEGQVDVQLRVNGEFFSNVVSGGASEQIAFSKYLALDENLYDGIDGLTFEKGQADQNQQLIWGNTITESWEEIDLGVLGTFKFNPSKVTALTDHEGHIRIYYSISVPTEENGVRSSTSAIGVIKSEDNGNTWQKVRLNGSPDIIDNPNSNFITVRKMPDGSELNRFEFCVYYDKNDSNKPYKFLSETQSGERVAGYSVDGYDWIPTNYIGEIGGGDSSLDSLFYDENRGEWMVFGRSRGAGTPEGEPPNPFMERRRVIFGKTKNWNDSPYDSLPIRLDDTWVNGGTFEVTNTAIDPAKVDYYDYWLTNFNESPLIKTDLYRGGIQNYFGYYIGVLPSYFRNDNRRPAERLERTTGEIYPTLFYGKNENDLKTRDGVHPIVNLTPYERIDTLNTSGGATEVGQLYPATNFVYTDQKIIIFVMDRTQTHYESNEGVTTSLDDDRTIESQEMRIDGFGKLTAGGTEGYWRTPIITIPNNVTNMKINSDGDVEVELLTSTQGTPITGFTKSDSDIINTDAVSNLVTWNNQNKISQLAGQNCRIKLYITNGSVYSFWFDTENIISDWGQNVYEYALLSDNPTSEYKISWIDNNSNADGSEQTLNYGLDINNLNQSVTVQGQLIPSSNSYIYHATVTGLNENTQYFAEIFKNNNEQKAIPSFKTFESSLSSSMNIGFLSDIHIDKDDNNSMYNPIEMNNIRSKNPDVMCLVGDIVSNGYNRTEGNTFWFMKFFREHIGNLNQNGLVPLFAVGGNHDLGYSYSGYPYDSSLTQEDPTRGYFQIFFDNTKNFDPVSENSGSVKFGNYLQLLGIDTFSSQPSDAGSFLSSKIDSNMTYAIPFMHSPLLQGAFRTTADEELQDLLRKQLADTMYQSGNVYGYFTGHMHVNFKSHPWTIVEDTIAPNDSISLGNNKYMVRSFSDYRLTEYGQGYRNNRDLVNPWYVASSDNTEGLNTYYIVTIDSENFTVKGYDKNNNVLHDNQLNIVRFEENFKRFTVKGVDWTIDGNLIFADGRLKVRWEDEDLKYVQTKYRITNNGSERISNAYSVFNVPLRNSYLLEYDVYFENVWNFNTIGQDQTLLEQQIVEYIDGVNTISEAQQYIIDEGWTVNATYADTGYPFQTGKLHGMMSTGNATGSNPMQPDEWSVRVTWLRNQTSHNESGQTDPSKLADTAPPTFAIYYYGQDRTETNGDWDAGKHIPATNFSGIEKERWYTIRLFVKLNDFGQSNAELSLEIRDKFTKELLGNVSANNIQLHNSTDTNSIQVRNFMFSTFFGGGDIRYQPQMLEEWVSSGQVTGDNVYTYARFANIKMVDVPEMIDFN